MSTSLNQSAPPATQTATKDFVKLEVFPRSDTFVLTLCGFNYIPDHPFNRTDEKTGEKYIKVAAGIEFYYGALVDGKACFLKTWPQSYSLNEKANYAKWYAAAVGKAPVPGTNPSEMLGKHVLGEVEVEEKTGGRGTKYKVSVLKSVTKVPSILASTGTPLKDLSAAFEAALAKKEEAPF
jgi:hypothetical protein